MSSANEICCKFIAIIYYISNASFWAEDLFSAHTFVHLLMPNGDGDGPGSEDEHPAGGKDHNKGGGKRFADHEVKLVFT